MAKNMTTITRKYVLIPEKSDSKHWEKRVYDYTVSDLNKRISFYEEQLKKGKKKEDREKAKKRIEELKGELNAFVCDPKINQKIVNNYTYGLVRISMQEEAERKNYIVEYVRMILTAEHAYTLSPVERNKRIKEILKYAYRKKGSKSGSLFDEVEIGNILGSYGLAFNQMLTKKIQDCCNKGALVGRAGFPFFKMDSPFTIAKADMGFTHEYDTFEELCEHVNDCKLYFSYGANGNPHIARFRIDLGHGKNRQELMSTILKVYSGEYPYCGSSIQLEKNKIVLNLTMQVPKQTKELDENTVVGVNLGMVVPAMCALNNDKYKRLAIGDENDFIRMRTKLQQQRSRLQAGLRNTAGGHGREKKLKALERLKNQEAHFNETYSHMVSRRIVEFALNNNAKYINLENFTGMDKDNVVLKNFIYYKIEQYTTYKAEHYGIIVRKINPCYNGQVCSIDGNWAPGQRISRNVFKCANPDCESHIIYKKSGFDADFNNARNNAMSTLFMTKGQVSGKSMEEAREYYGFEEEYKKFLEEQ